MLLTIAKTYRNNQPHWISVAQNLRAPYWDWATNNVPPPVPVYFQPLIRLFHRLGTLIRQ